MKDISAVNRFKIFRTPLYTLNSQSPKNQRELKGDVKDLDVQLCPMGRMLQLHLRYVSSSFRTVKAAFNCCLASCDHFTMASIDSSWQDKSKHQGRIRKLQSTQFLGDLALKFDTLLQLSSLPQLLQPRSMTIPKASKLIERTMWLVGSFRSSPGNKMDRADPASEQGVYRDVTLHSNATITFIKRGQFFANLVTNLKQNWLQSHSLSSLRLSLDANTSLQVLRNEYKKLVKKVLDPETWSKNDI